MEALNVLSHKILKLPQISVSSPTFGLARLGIVLAAALTLAVNPSRVAAQSLDFEFFKTQVQPIFLQKRPNHARCVVCHQGGSSAFRLEKLPAGSSTWTEEQSRKNFERASGLVVPGDPASSRLLMHGLSPEAGGDPFHSGGRQFSSQTDPAWLILAQWVRGQKAAVK